jgi:GntR family galactonate operon transcriptional repressor
LCAGSGFGLCAAISSRAICCPPRITLAADFAVSRNVVREAIRALAAKGLVRGRPPTGTQILPRNQWNLLDDDVLEWQLVAAVRDRDRHLPARPQRELERPADLLEEFVP